MTLEELKAQAASHEELGLRGVSIDPAIALALIDVATSARSFSSRYPVDGDLLNALEALTAALAAQEKT